MKDYCNKCKKYVSLEQQDTKYCWNCEYNLVEHRPKPLKLIKIKDMVL